MAVIAIERKVAQVEVGKKYEVRVAYLGTTLDFTVEFPGGIKAFSTAEPSSVDEVRMLAPLSLTKGDEVVTLEDDEYVEFILLIGPDVWEFAEHPQTIATNESPTLNRLTESGFASVEASITFSNDYEVGTDHPFLYPKFGATLPDA